MAIRLKPLFWIVGLSLLLAIITFLIHQQYGFIFWGIWLPWILMIGLALYPPLRHFLITKPIYQALLKTLTPMSLTEKQAIEAGGLGWEQGLFSGQPDFQGIKKLSYPELSTEEKAFIDGPVEALCARLNDWEIQQNNDLPPEIWTFLKDHHFFGLLIQKTWGGLEFSASAHSIIIMKIASCSLTAAITAMVPNSLGPGELIQKYGTLNQKQYYLPRLAKGIEIPCFALTSLEAGSDATALTDQGVLCKAKHEDEEKLCIRLNWNKRYITLAPVATLIGLAFKLYDPDHLLGSQTHLGMTLALIPANHPGVEIGRRHKPMHMAFMNGPIQGKEVLIPVDWIIGGTQQMGKGWEMMLDCLSAGRGISLPALATSNAKMAFCLTGAYAYLREQFHLPIGKFEGIQEQLGKIGGLAYLCEAVRSFTVNTIDSGIHSSLASAITKYHITEIGRSIGNAALDIHGGRAIQLGPRNYLANMYDAIPISITVEGANILTRTLIIFGQGIIRCHPYLKQEIDAIQEKSLKKFDILLVKHIGYFLRSFSRILLFNLGVHRLVPVPFKGTARYYAQQIMRISNALAFLSDVALMRFGNSLKRREFLSARLGDVLSYLYMASALIKYDEKSQQTSKATQAQNPCLEWAMGFCFYQTQEALKAFVDNLKYPCLRFFLKIWLFPFGDIYKAPKDHLNQAISRLMMQDSSLRQQMSQHCYIKPIESDAVGRVELAFKICFQSEPIRKKVKAAIQAGKITLSDPWEAQLAQAVQLNIIQPSEVDTLLNAEKKRQDSLRVDEF